MGSKNEEILHFAYSLGRLSTVCFVFAFFLPLVAISRQIDIAGDYTVLFLIISTIGWILAGVALHSFGARVLEGLK